MSMNGQIEEQTREVTFEQLLIERLTQRLGQMMTANETLALQNEVLRSQLPQPAPTDTTA